MNEKVSLQEYQRMMSVSIQSQSMRSHGSVISKSPSIPSQSLLDKFSDMK